MATQYPSRVAIVIVNWNSGPLLRRCLESFVRCNGLDRIAQVVIVDNGSSDGSCDSLPDAMVPVCVIKNEENRGFAAACNQGASLCRADYLLFLNPDAELLPNSLIEPLEYMDDPRRQDVGICGIQLLDKKGRVARSCARLPTSYSLVTSALRLHGLSRRLFPSHFMKEWDHLQTRNVDQVIGAFFLVRGALFGQLAGFDERFFVYYEEVDFCARARQAGQGTVYLASAQARHVGAGCSNQVRGRTLFYSLRSRIAYAEKHLPQWSKLITASTMIAEPSIRITAAVVRLKWHTLPQLIYGFGKLWLDRFVPRVTVRTPMPQNSIPLSRLHFADRGCQTESRAA